MRGGRVFHGGMGVPEGWEFQGGWVFQGGGGGSSRGVSVLGDGCLGGWEFLIPHVSNMCLLIASLNDLNLDL